MLGNCHPGSHNAVRNLGILLAGSDLWAAQELLRERRGARLEPARTGRVGRISHHAGRHPVRVNRQRRKTSIGLMRAGERTCHRRSQCGRRGPPRRGESWCPSSVARWRCGRAWSRGASSPCRTAHYVGADQEVCFGDGVAGAGLGHGVDPSAMATGPRAHAHQCARTRTADAPTSPPQLSIEVTNISPKREIEIAHV